MPGPLNLTLVSQKNGTFVDAVLSEVAASDGSVCTKGAKHYLKVDVDDPEFDEYDTNEDGSDRAVIYTKYKGTLAVDNLSEGIAVFVKISAGLASARSLIEEANNYRRIHERGSGDAVAEYYGFFKGRFTLSLSELYGRSPREHYCLIYGNGSAKLLTVLNMTRSSFHAMDKLQAMSNLAAVHKAGLRPSLEDDHTEVIIQHDQNGFKIADLHGWVAHECAATPRQDLWVDQEQPSADEMGCAYLWATCSYIGLWKCDGDRKIGSETMDAEGLPSQRVIDVLMPSCVAVTSSKSIDYLCSYFSSIAAEVGPDEEQYIAAHVQHRNAKFLRFLPDTISARAEWGMFGYGTSLQAVRAQYIGEGSA